MKKKSKKKTAAKKPRKLGYKAFLSSYDWKKLRTEALNRDGCRCVLCGSHEHLSVHHVLPRKGWRELELDVQNTVTLCAAHHTWGPCSCHRGVGYVLLIEWLRENRPDQYAWIMQRIGK